MARRSASRAREPFRFYDYEGLVMVTGLKASNLRELCDMLRRVPGEMVHHHLYRSFLVHRYGSWDWPNDFANWAAEALGDRALAEKLAAMEPFSHRDIEKARAAIVDLIDEHLDELPAIPWARRGFEFHFASGHFLELPTGREAWTVAELRDGIAHAPLASLYFHFHEARLRGEGHDSDDYARWIEGQFGASPAVDRLRRIDFYFYSLDELRQRVLRVLGAPAGREEVACPRHRSTRTPRSWDATGSTSCAGSRPGSRGCAWSS